MLKCIIAVTALAIGLGPAAAQELRFASWPEVVAMIPCDRVARDDAGVWWVIGPIGVEEKRFYRRAVTSAFEARELAGRCLARAGFTKRTLPRQ